jgi:hypothetical protein
MDRSEISDVAQQVANVEHLRSVSDERGSRIVADEIETKLSPIAGAGAAGARRRALRPGGESLALRARQERDREFRRRRRAMELMIGG